MPNRASGAAWGLRASRPAGMVAEGRGRVMKKREQTKTESKTERRWHKACEAYLKARAVVKRAETARDKAWARLSAAWEAREKANG